MTSNKSQTYRDAGVDIEAGNALVERIKPLARATARTGSAPALGGFGAFFDPRAAGFAYPQLVAATDGVGTKLKIAIESGIHETVGIDLVAMCVNDLVVQGAEPLFFLDYFATGALDIEAAATVIAGIAEGCKQAGCALIGGETAEMPGMYAAKDYDLAGFAVGAVERGQELTGAAISDDDVIIGLASSGFHSNGYSLVRRLVDLAGLDWQDPAPFDPSRSLAQALLEPTKIYVRSCLAAIRAGLVHGLAHITGGGFSENIPRILPSGLGAGIDVDWPLPPCFAWAGAQGNIAPEEMARTFNCGFGMIVIVPRDKADEAMDLFAAQGEEARIIGHVDAAISGVVMNGAEEKWKN